MGLAHHAIFQDVHIAEKVEGLKNHSHLGAIVVHVHSSLEDVLAVNQDLPGVGGLQQIDAPQKGGFAGARGTDKADDLPGGDAEPDVV